MFEPDDHSVTAIVECIFLDVGRGLSLSTSKGWSAIDTAMTSSHVCLPLLEVVIEVMIHRHWGVAAFHLEEEIGTRNCLLISPDQLFKELHG